MAISIPPLNRDPYELERKYAKLAKMIHDADPSPIGNSNTEIVLGKIIVEANRAKTIEDKIVKALEVLIEESYDSQKTNPFARLRVLEQAADVIVKLKGEVKWNSTK